MGKAMRVLITGRNGQLGGSLANTLAPLGDLLVVGRDELDLSRPETIASFLDANSLTLIVNAAAYTQVDNAETDRNTAFAVNEAAPYELATWAKTHNVPMIHYSTDYVFDGSGESFWREDDPTGPLGVYGESKLAGENAVCASSGPAMVLRTSWVYSAERPCFLTTMLKLGAERPALSIVDDQTGAPTPASWLAVMTAKILIGNKGGGWRDAFNKTPQIYHIVPSGVCSWFGFAEAIFSEARNQGSPLAIETLIPIPSKEYPTPAERPRNSRLNTQKFRTRFNVEFPDWRDLLSGIMH